MVCSLPEKEDAESADWDALSVLNIENKMETEAPIFF
jgi:hypothetical protein